MSSLSNFFLCYETNTSNQYNTQFNMNQIYKIHLAKFVKLIKYADFELFKIDLINQACSNNSIHELMKLIKLTKFVNFIELSNSLNRQIHKLVKFIKFVKFLVSNSSNFPCLGICFIKSFFLNSKEKVSQFILIINNFAVTATKLFSLSHFCSKD